MKVAWFTPLSTHSAVAEYSTHVALALAEHCQIDLWVGDDDRHRSTPLRTFEFHDEPALLHRLAQYDLAVYNIGNYDAFHGAIYEASKWRPGIVILHDRSCHHLFAAHWLGAGEARRYLDRMEALYGHAGRERARAAVEDRQPPIWESDEEALRYPLVEEALVGALGAAVHSGDHAGDLRDRWFGPVGELFLPSYRTAPHNAPARGGDDRTTLLTLGHVNRNKQIDRVLRLLDRDRELAARVRYLVVGPGLEAAYGQELVRYTQEAGLDGVSFLGYQSDEVVDRLLAESDVCVNLRFPPLEGSSASLLRQLEIGKAVLAFDVGGFSEVPDGAIVKVQPGDDDALELALRSLVEDANRRDSVGAAAAAYAGPLTAERYAEAFLDLAETVDSWAPVVRTVDRVADELTLLGARGELPAVELAGRELETFFGQIDAKPLQRGLGPGDRPALGRFLRRNDVPEVTGHFHPFPMTEVTAEEISLRPGADRYYGAFIEGRLVALSMLRGWNEGFDVPSFGIVVDAAWHGRGIGSMLTDFTLERVPWLGSERVRLTVYKSNDRAYRMYADRGFSEVERAPIERAGERDERIVMVKELT